MLNTGMTLQKVSAPERQQEAQAQSQEPVHEISAPEREQEAQEQSQEPLHEVAAPEREQDNEAQHWDDSPRSCCPLEGAGGSATIPGA